MRLYLYPYFSIQIRYSHMEDLNETLFRQNGFVFNPEGRNDLEECYYNTTKDQTEYYKVNGDNPGYWDHIVISNSGDVIVEETITL